MTVKYGWQANRICKYWKIRSAGAAADQLLSAHLHQMKLQATEWGFKQLCIICVIRHQDHWLASHYAQISDRIPMPDQTDVEIIVREVVSPGKSRYSFGMLLDYNILYDHLIDVAGKDNLLVLP